MKIQLRGTRKHGHYQLHVSTWQTPVNWFEKWILNRPAQVVHYVGKGEKWFIMQSSDTTLVDYTPVTDKQLITWLQSIKLGDENKKVNESH